MSGHNKWSTIKHKKGKTDAARGKLFTRLIRELVVATRSGGKDPDSNARLRSAMTTARNANMPKDTMERAVKRGAGEIEGETYDELTYEGYGPSGIAFFIEVVTSNRNRIVAELRHALNKHGGNLGNDGSVAWMFERVGLVEIATEGTDFDALFEAAVDAGAEDVREPEGEDGNYIVACEFAELHTVSGALESAGFTVLSANAVRETTNPMPISGSQVDKTLRLLDVLEENDDVQHVYINAEISDEDIARLSS